MKKILYVVGYIKLRFVILKFDCIAKVIAKFVIYAVYVDDLQITCVSFSISMCERQMQVIVNKLSPWADRNKFKFFPQKKKTRKNRCSEMQ